MGDYGLKVSRDGYSTATATPLQQVFNTSFNCLKVQSKLDVSSTGSGFRDVNVSHSFGYRPAFMAFFEVSDNGRWYAQGQLEDYSGGNGQLFEIESFTDKLRISFGSSNTKTIRAIIYLFVDPGE